MTAGRVIAHIPARAGSKRVPSKNLRYMAGKPMIEYTIRAALECMDLPEVYVNTDSDQIASLARELGCNVYRREARLGGDDVRGEEFTMDIIDSLRVDTLVMVSPVCPLIDAADISAAWKAYLSSDVDTLISASQTRLQTFCGGRPVNIDPDGPLAPSQDNEAVIVCNWAITIWNASVFRSNFLRNRSGYFGTKRMFWHLDPMKSVKISTEEDFRFAELILETRSQRIQKETRPRYWGGEMMNREVEKGDS